MVPEAIAEREAAQNRLAFEFMVEIKRALLRAGLTYVEVATHVFPMGQNPAKERDYDWTISLRIERRPVLITGWARVNGSPDYRMLMTRLQRQLRYKRIPWPNRLRMWCHVCFGGF